MAIPTTIINARVKQKIATNDYWLSIDDELGVILAGEMALVYNDEGLAVNFKVGDGTKKYSELPFFITYFNNVTNCKVLSYVDQSANLTIPLVFRNKSELAKIVFVNQSGEEQTIKFGTTDGGSEIAEIEVPNDIVNITLDYDFTGPETVYVTGLTGVNYSMFILYYQLDEAPVVPSGGGSGGITKRYVPGDIYHFIPLYDGHEEVEFDLITGYGRVGTDHEGTVLFGTAGMPIDMTDVYLKGYKFGDTLGGLMGNTDNEIEIMADNLPEHDHLMFNGDVQSGGGNDLDDGSYVKFERNGSLTRAYIMAKSGTTPDRGKTSKYGSSDPDAINIQPKSRSVLLFTGISST